MNQLSLLKALKVGTTERPAPSPELKLVLRTTSILALTSRPFLLLNSRTPMGNNLIPRRAPSEGPPKGLKTGEQKFRSLHAPDILVQAPIRAPCSIASRFGAGRAEIRPIGAITWGALPSSPNPSGHSAWRATYHIDEEVDAKTASHL
jgi:hypothetical protein